MADDSSQVAQRETLTGTMHNSPRMLQLRAHAHSINNSPRVMQLNAFADSINNSRWAAGQQMARDAAFDAAMMAESSRQDGSRTVVQRVEWDDVKDSPDIRIEKEGPNFVAFFKNERAGELELYDDDREREWINYIDVEERFQKKGIGLSLLNAAVAEHGAIYAAVGMQKNEENGGDTRHLSVEGAALVTSAVRNGILQPGWCFNPAMENEGGDYEYGSDQEYDEEKGNLEEWNDQQEALAEDDEPEAPYTAVVVLDNSNTGELGYQYWVELTDTANNQTTTVEFDNLISGEDSLTTGGLEQALFNALGEDVHLSSWQIDYTDG